MERIRLKLRLASALGLLVLSAGAQATSLPTAIVSYASLTDMLDDTNRVNVVEPSGGGDFDDNIVGSGSDGTTYWNVFNEENDRTLSTAIVTYATLSDMLSDTNRMRVVAPSGGGSFDLNIVDSGSDGTTYWNVFNEEDDRTLSTAIVTYATLSDMLNDTNRLSVVTPSGGGDFDLNIVGSGSDGKTYWNVFNEEEDQTLSTAIVTYATLTDMLNDTNRLGVATPSGGGDSDLNIVGAGSDGKSYWSVFNQEDFAASSPAPEPKSWAMLLLGFGAVGTTLRRRVGSAALVPRA